MTKNWKELKRNRKFDIFLIKIEIYLPQASLKDVQTMSKHEISKLFSLFL